MVFTTSDDGLLWTCTTAASKVRIHNNKNIPLVLDEAEEPEDVLIRVALERPEPNGVKLSRKNVALITVTPEERDDAGLEKLIWFYLNEKNPTWGSQFS